MSYTLPASFQDIRAQLPRANPQYRMHRDLSAVSIVSVHYDAMARPDKYSAIDRLKGEANYHISKDWDPPHGVYGFGLMYHIRIEDQDSSDGKAEIFFCNALEDILWNITNANHIGVGICLSAGEGQEPTAPMYEALKTVIEWLLTVLPNSSKSRVFGHGELTQYGNSTSCPGRTLPWVVEYRKGAPLPNPNAQFFPETGHSVGHGFLDFFNAHGGVPIFGYPISEEVSGKVGEWTGTVQYFERARFEYHTEGGTSQVMLGRLGAEAQESAQALMSTPCDCH